MSLTTELAWNISRPPPLPMRRSTVDEYHRMIGAGVFAEDERFELLEGWIVSKMTRNPPHDVAIAIIPESLRALLPTGWHIRAQSAITTPDSEPDPDIVIVRGAFRDYLSRHPNPSDIVLVVEVSDSTLAQDREIKGRLYARAGIPVYWIVNLVDWVVEVYTDPSGPVVIPTYGTRQDHRIGERIPLAIHGQVVAQIDAGDLLP
jgi:Uma2 family endonuclease